MATLGREAERDAIHWRSPGLPFPVILSWISEQPEVSGRTVVDQTGLNGRFDCELTWTRDKTDPADSSFFTALRNRVGLRLRLGAVEILVVQNTERPSANEWSHSSLVPNAEVGQARLPSLRMLAQNG